jgi:hypothetical protein
MRKTAQMNQFSLLYNSHSHHPYNFQYDISSHPTKIYLLYDKSDQSFSAFSGIAILKSLVGAGEGCCHLNVTQYTALLPT